MRYILLLLLIGGCADNQEKCPHFERFSSVPDSMFVSKAQNGLGEWMYDLKNPIWIDGIPCSSDAPPEHQELTTDSLGNLIRANLLHPIMRNQIPCRDYVFLYPNGRLQHTTLDKAIKMHGFAIAEGEMVYLHSNGILASTWLGADKTIGHLQMKKGDQIWLDEKARLISVASGWDGLIFKGKKYRNQTLTFDTVGNLIDVECKVANPSN